MTDNGNMESANTNGRNLMFYIRIMFYVRITKESDRHALPLVSGNVRLTFGPYDSRAAAQERAVELRDYGFSAVVAPLASGDDLDRFIINELAPVEAQMIGERRAGTQ